MDADGINPRQLTFGSTANNPSVTSDSRWVVYDAATVATAHLFKVSVDGGDPQELTTATSHFPVVSPDGKLIAFSYWAGGSAPVTLSTVGIGGGTLRRSFRVPTEACRWQRDGRALIRVDSRPGQSSLMRLPLDTGIPTPFTPFGSGRISAFDISPDGKRVVFVRVTSESRVVKMGGFR